MQKLDKIGVGNAKPLVSNTAPVYAEDYNKVVEGVNAIIDTSPVKAYYSFLTQTGTNAPVANILVDTLSNPIWEYSAVGTYTINKSNTFTSGKTAPFSAITYDISGNKITAEWTSVSVITIKTYAAADTTVLANDVLSNQEFNIEIYN
jgi:hypothetical protein